MTNRYNQIPKEENISIEVWEKTNPQMQKVPPYVLHKYENIFSKIKFIEELLVGIMKERNIDRDKAIEMLNNSHFYQTFAQCGVNFVFHYSPKYWAKEIISLYDE